MLVRGEVGMIVPGEVGSGAVYGGFGGGPAPASAARKPSLGPQAGPGEVRGESLFDSEAWKETMEMLAVPFNGRATMPATHEELKAHAAMKASLAAPGRGMAGLWPIAIAAAVGWFLRGSA